MPPRKTTAGELKIRLAGPDIDNLERIAEELHHRDPTGLPNRSRTVRWALRELAARIWMSRASVAAGEVALTGPGPATLPPGMESESE